ncbi:hypothetical protein B0H13DRAFT_2227852 [Mycena leptocephala]|nr:hypothetical protein B0H13DRAFT_2227852 [Mycena leptocephala]
MTPSRGPRTLYDKIWDDHVVTGHINELTLVYIDRHLLHEVSSPQAFDGLRAAGHTVRRPDCTLATVDHNVPTTKRVSGAHELSSLIRDPESRAQCAALERNVKEFGLAYFGLQDKRQGIVHVVGPEQGFTLPGKVTCVSHGAFGALAFGIGTSEVEHVLATQTIVQKKSRNMWITVDGELFEGVDSKDVILHIIGVIGAAGGNGCVIEYSGSVIRGFSMTVCNMSVEAGSRAGQAWDRAEAYWRTLKSDEGATFDIEVNILASEIIPSVTWGTSPLDDVQITGTVPHPAAFSNPDRRRAAERSLEYMDLLPGTPMEDVKIDNVFIGSCTNGRIEDLRSAANICNAMVVPGSSLVKRQAEAEGLDAIFKRAGFDWREAGCSISANRNFEGRQGAGGRTHLLSPAMAAAAAIRGKLSDVRQFHHRKSSRLVDLDTLSSVPLVDHGPETFPVSPGVIQQPTAPQAPSGTPKIFRVLKGIAAPMYIENIDCAQTIPQNNRLFYNLRNDANTGAHLAFVLDRAPYNEATILISTGKNFGCGSSREHAAWSL